MRRTSPARACSHSTGSAEQQEQRSRRRRAPARGGATIERASRSQAPRPPAAGVRAAADSLRTPSSDRSTGWRVSAAAIAAQRDEEAADAQRADERDRDEQRAARARSRPPCPRTRPCGRRSPSSARRRRRGRAAVPELLAEAVDDQERVVDREPEPDHRDEVRDVGRGREQLARPRRRPAARRRSCRRRTRTGSRPPRESPKTASRTISAAGTATRLGAAQVGGQHRVEVVLDRRLPGDEPAGPGAGAQRPSGRLRVPSRPP